MLESGKSGRAFDVLVVEDELDTREALEELLDGHGYRVAAAENGEEALRILLEDDERPRLVLLDLKMPVMDGWEFCRRVGCDPALNGIPITILSGTTVRDPEELPARRADAGFLAKPLDFERLLSVIEAHCGPRERAASPPSAEPDSRRGEAAEVDHAAHRVLVVEDDPDLRETLASILTAEGYIVTTARHGREAMASLLTGSRPSLILVDLLMPVMDGWQLCEELAGEPQLEGIPIILMSASGGPLLPPRPQRLVRLFRKPFTFLQLLDAVAKGCAASLEATGGPATA